MWRDLREKGEGTLKNMQCCVFNGLRPVQHVKGHIQFFFSVSSSFRPVLDHNLLLVSGCVCAHHVANLREDKIRLHVVQQHVES